MELFAKPSRIAYHRRYKARARDFSLFEELCSKYAQNVPLMDPTQLQEGQPIYDPEGVEWLVVDDPEGTMNKVVMPADQAGAQLPEGVQTVEDDELASMYTLQPSGGTPTASKKADIIMNLTADDMPNSKSITSDDELDNLRLGENGYVEIMDSIKEMTKAGYGVVDVLLNIGEMYPREIGERVLAEARRKGIL